MTDTEKSSREGAPSLWHVSRRLSSTFRAELWAERRAFALSYLYTCFAVGALLLVPWPLQLIIDFVLAGKPLPLPLIGELGSDIQILVLGVSTIVIAVLRISFVTLEKMSNARIRERITVAIRDRLLTHAQTLPLDGQVEGRSGELVLRLVNDVSQFARLITRALPVSINHLITTVSTLAVMFFVEPILACVGALVLVVIVWLARRYATPLHKASRERRRREGEVTALAQEIIRNLPTTQATSQEEFTQTRFREVNRRSLYSGVREVQVGVAMERSMAIARSSALAAISVGGAMLVLRESFTVGELTVFLTYMSQLLRPAEKANEQVSTIIRSLARGETIQELLDRKPAVTDEPGAEDLDDCAGRLQLCSVSFAYPSAEPDQQYVFENVNVLLEPGTLTAIVGASGSGKSSLVSLMLRLYDPTDGEIRLDGTPLPAIRLAALRRQFAVMVQDTRLFAGTIRDSLQLGVEASDGDIWHVLTEVGLADWARSMPGQLDAALGEDGQNLSGGQRARLSLARACSCGGPFCCSMSRPRMSTPFSRDLILAAIERVRPHTTCIVTTHNPEVMEHADQVLRIQGQEVVVESRQRNVRYENVG